MSQLPPESFVPYPRATAGQIDSADRLQSLSEGYFGLYYVLLVGLVLYVAVGFIAPVVSDRFWIAIYGLPTLIQACAAYPAMRRIGYGLRWSPSRSVFASAVIGLGFILCFGVLGISIYQGMAMRGILRLGVPKRFIGGFRKADVSARLAELRERADYMRRP